MTTVSIFDLNHNFAVLSPREKDVVICFLRGMSIEDSAEFLHVKPKTIEKHRTNIHQKLKIKKMNAVYPILLK